MHQKRVQVSLAAAVLGVILFACRPVIAVGWSELLILSLIIAFAFFPWLVKIVRFYLQREEQHEEKRERKEE